MWIKNRDAKESAVFDEGIREFKHQATLLMRVGDLEGLRFLYSNCVATARLENPEKEKEIVQQAREALRNTLLEPSRRVKREWFDDL